MQKQTFTPTNAVLENIQRGFALDEKYPRDSIIGVRRSQQIDNIRKYVKEGFDIEAVKDIYNTCRKLEKNLNFDTKAYDSGFTDDVINYYAHGGKSGFAWAKLTLKAAGLLPNTTEVIKAEGDKTSIDKIQVVKAQDTALMQVTYVAMNIGTDLHGDYSDEETVRLAKESFNKSLQSCYLFHAIETDLFSVAESYLAPCDLVLNGHFVQKGTWLMTLQVHSPALWDDILNETINGISIGAMATVIPENED